MIKLLLMLLRLNVVSTVGVANINILLRGVKRANLKVSILFPFLVNRV